MTMHDRLRIPLRRRGGVVVGGLTVVLVGGLLSGCTASPAADPAPAPTPSLTQEQQDDQAFRDVMTRYIDLDANSDIEDELNELLTGNVLNSEKDGLAEARRTGERQSGKEIASGFQVTDRGLDPAGLQYMTAQVCLDTGGLRLLDANGNDITPQHDTRRSLQVKAIKSPDSLWRISDIVRNEDVHACG
ncbi:hypothetical protein [Clavibacter michiganensis]|nr:hypothetical protein [Clavibacter michiganensis]MDO4081856.1 hypothetical protein [Clavibacter michiganensis]